MDDSHRNIRVIRNMQKDMMGASQVILDSEYPKTIFSDSQYDIFAKDFLECASQVKVFIRPES